jgi:hypothetical protein
MREVTDDLERPTLPVWIWVAVGVVLAILVMTVVGWLVSAAFAVLRLLVLVAVVLVVLGFVRWAFWRRD